MRVSPDPWHPEDDESPQETRKSRPEGVRILLFAVAYVAVYGGLRLISASPMRYVTLHPEIYGQSIGLILSWVSYAVILCSALLNVTVNKWLVFRSRQRWYVYLPLMLAATVAWRVVMALIQRVMLTSISDPTEAVLRMNDVSTMLSLAQMILFYLYQRFGIFRTTLDTL